MKRKFEKGFSPTLRIISFFLVLFVILQCLSLTCFSKEKAGEYNNKMSEAMSFYNEKENTIQIIAIGNSDLYSGFSPSVVWEQNGFTSTAIGSPRQSLKKSFYLLKEANKRQTPEIVIIECDMLYDTNPEESQILSKQNSIDVVFDYLNPEAFEETIQNKLSVFLFHDRWKNKKVKHKLNKHHGYKYSENIVPVVVKDSFMKQTDRSEGISEIHRKELRDIIDYCNACNIKVILTTFVSPSSWTYERHNAVNEFAHANNVPFIDFNLIYSQIGIDFKNDFRDRGNHLNCHGARKISAYLGNYIKENYNLTDHRNDKTFKNWC